MTRPILTRFAAPLALTAVLAAGCSRPAATAARPTSAGRLPSGALDQDIAQEIGDPTTCVLIADAATGKVLYRYGELFNCVRGLPACDRPGDMTGTQALKLAATPGGRETSCNSLPDGSRTVGWAEGTIPGAEPPLIYSAVMEGQRALPGHEMAARLSLVFSTVGL
jgi:hypothetical protein